jgi:hypothetical protein
MGRLQPARGVRLTLVVVDKGAAAARASGEVPYRFPHAVSQSYCGGHGAAQLCAASCSAVGTR